jgi:hypothetical protein
MDGRFPAFRASYVQASSGEVDIIPPKCNQLAGPQAMTIGQQDGGGVPMTMPVPVGSFHQPLDFLLGQVLSGSGGFHCYIYYGWSLEMDALNFHNNLSQFKYNCYNTGY